MKFDVTKRLDLHYLGKEWKKNDCFLEFEALTWEDMEGGFSDIGASDITDPDSVTAAMKTSSKLLIERFIKGRGMSGGKVVDITKDDFSQLPAEVSMRALNFLSQGLSQADEKPSETSSDPKDPSETPQEK